MRYYSYYHIVSFLLLLNPFFNYYWILFLGTRVVLFLMTYEKIIFTTHYTAQLSPRPGILKKSLEQFWSKDRRMCQGVPPEVCRKDRRCAARRIMLHRLVAVKGIRPAMIRGESGSGDPESRGDVRARIIWDVTRREMMMVLPVTSNVSSLSSISPRGFIVYVGVNIHTHTRRHVHVVPSQWARMSFKHEISPIRVRCDADARVAES